MSSDTMEREIFEVIVKNVRLLCDTWPHDAEERIVLFRRQLLGLDLVRDANQRDGTPVR